MQKISKLVGWVVIILTFTLILSIFVMNTKSEIITGNVYKVVENKIWIDVSHWFESGSEKNDIGYFLKVVVNEDTKIIDSSGKFQKLGNIKNNAKITVKINKSISTNNKDILDETFSATELIIE